MKYIKLNFVILIILGINGCYEKDNLSKETQIDCQYVVNGKIVNCQSKSNFVRLDFLANASNLDININQAVVPFNKVLDVNSNAEGSLNINKEEWCDYHIYSGAVINFYRNSRIKSK